MILQIPYVIAKGTAFYERKEIRDAVSYLKVILNPSDSVSLRRIINTPPRGIGDRTVKILQRIAQETGQTLFQVMSTVSQFDSITKRGKHSVSEFCKKISGWQQIAKNNYSMENSKSRKLSFLIEKVIVESGLEEMFKNSNNIEDQDRLLNLEELISAASSFQPVTLESFENDEYENNELASFLESIALVSDADKIDPEKGSVTLMTLHAAKGLEFKFVAMAGLEEGLLPHSRSVGNTDELEEERRLCYVGMTRAKDNLMLTSARYRSQRGVRMRTIPSSFLQEIPSECVNNNQSESDSEFNSRNVPSPKFENNLDSDELPVVRQEESLTIGSRVRHSSFGVGHVMRILRGPRGSRAQIKFSSGVRTLILEYAPLERLD